MVLDHDAVVENRYGRFFDKAALVVPARRFKNDVVGLPFARRFAGVDQRRRLAVDGRALAVRVSLGLEGVEHLNFVHAVDENAAVAAALACASGRGGLGKFDVQLEIGPLAARANAAAAPGLDATIPHWPGRSLPPAVLPLGKVLAIEEDLGIRGRRGVLAEGRPWGDDAGLRAIRVVQVPFAAREHRRVPEAINGFSRRGRGIGGRRGQTRCEQGQTEDEWVDMQFVFHGVDNTGQHTAGVNPSQILIGFAFFLANSRRGVKNAVQWTVWQECCFRTIRAWCGIERCACSTREFS